MLEVGCIKRARGIVDAHLDQALLALIGNHIGAGRHIFDGLGITKTFEIDGALEFALQADLDHLGRLVGDAEQAAAIRIIGQRRHIADIGNGLGFDHHAVVAQPQRLIAPLRTMLPLLHGEPGSLEQPILLAQHGAKQQDEEQQIEPGVYGEQTTHDEFL